jgi:hypothetical protein
LVTHRHLCTFALRHSPRPQLSCRDDAAHLRRLFGTANIAVELFGARPQPCVLRPRRRSSIVRIGDRQKARSNSPPSNANHFRGNVFLDTPHARSAFFVSTARALSRRDGAVYSVRRARDKLDVDHRFSADPLRMQRNKFFILGRDSLERTRRRLGDIHSYVDKLLFHVVNNSCFLDASWPGRSCPRG